MHLSLCSRDMLYASVTSYSIKFILPICAAAKDLQLELKWKVVSQRTESKGWNTNAWHTFKLFISKKFWKTLYRFPSTSERLWCHRDSRASAADLHQTSHCSTSQVGFDEAIDCWLVFPLQAFVVQLVEKRNLTNCMKEENTSFVFAELLQECCFKLNNKNNSVAGDLYKIKTSICTFN